MKKSLVALAALAATGAFAQATITGSLNMGYKNSAAGVTSVGGLKGDRNNLTFAASEDLGGGMKAAATLQIRFDSMNGGNTYSNSVSSSKENNAFEQTKMAISGGFGEVAMGRFTNALGVAPIHFMEDSAYSAASTTIYGRESGQFQYTSPSLSGAQVWYLTARKDQNASQGATGNGFTAGAFSASGVFAAATPTPTRDLGVMGVNFANGPVYVHLASINGMVDEKSSVWGATYDLGVAKVGVSQYRQGADIGTLAKHTSTEYGVQVPFGAFVAALTFQTNNNDLKVGTTDGSTQMKKTGYKLYYSLSKSVTAEFEGSNISSAASAADNGSAYYVGLRKTF